jgi:hypothetical protein
MMILAEAVDATDSSIGGWMNIVLLLNTDMM